MQKQVSKIYFRKNHFEKEITTIEKDLEKLNRGNIIIDMTR